MHVNEKVLFGALLIVVFIIVSWAMAISVINSSKITVIESRVIAHMRAMEDLRVTMESHRTLTERRP
jgi:hypothetical protein